MHNMVKGLRLTKSWLYSWSYSSFS